MINSTDEFEEMLAYLKRRSENWQYIEIRSHGPNLHGLAGFHQDRTFQHHRLDLRPSLDELFRGFHKNCVQRKIRRAERAGLVYERGRSEPLLAKFYGLMLLTRRRQGIPPQPLVWFRNLAACLGEALTIRIATKEKVPIAGMLTLRHKRVLVYKYGCSNQRYNHLGGTQFLFWQAIQEAKRDQIDELDMGRSDNEASGLIAFKDRWGAAQSRLAYWTCPARRPETHVRTWSVQAAKRLLPLLPDRCLTVAGRLLYRHAG